MFIVKLALITCAVYIGITLVMVLGGFVIVYLKGMLAHSFNFRAWTIVFGLVWFVFFVIAWLWSARTPPTGNSSM